MKGMNEMEYWWTEGKNNNNRRKKNHEKWNDVERDQVTETIV